MLTLLEFITYICQFRIRTYGLDSHDEIITGTTLLKQTFVIFQLKDLFPIYFVRL